MSKNQIVERLSAVFEQYGFEGASLKMLADAAELSKASLYHHFPKGKEDMAAHVLGYAGTRLQALVLTTLASSENGAPRLLRSLDGTAEYYSGTVPVCLMNSLLIGGGRALFGQQIKTAVELWRKGMATAYEQAGAEPNEAQAWAAYAIERIQGALVFCRVNGSREALENCLAELQADVTYLADG